jgi:ABC-2 type transport system ATP-binding protein
MIQLNRVSKRFGGQTALCDVSLTLAGSVALIGPNGSGKTTLLRLLATLIRCDSGRIAWNGTDYGAQTRSLRERIGYVPQHVELPGNLTPRLLLRYLAQIRRIPDSARPDLLLSALRLGRVANTPLSALSGGQLRLVCIAQALLSQPEILVLDEVFSGLGIEERQIVTRLLTVENPARLMVFSVQTVDDAERLARDVVILKDGCVSYHGGIGQLRDLNPGTANGA